MAEGDDWIWFGDGNMCIYLEKFERTDEDGVEIVHFLIRPSNPMQNEYDLNEHIDSRDGLMMVEFPKTAVEPLVNMPGKNRILVVYNVLGEPTPLSRKSAVLETQVIQQQKIIRAQEIQISTLAEKYKKLSERETESIKDARKMFEEAHKVRGRLKRDEDEEEDL